MLAGLIRSPNYYDPLAHPVKARIRRNVVLERLGGPRMGAAGADRQGQGVAAAAWPRTSARSKLRQPPFFVRYITERIVANTDGEFDVFGKSGERAGVGACTKAACGSSPRSTPTGRPRRRPVANQPYRESRREPELRADTRHVDRLRRQRDGRDPNDALGPQLPEGPGEPGRRRRQSGSSFKPFTLVAAFREGIPPGSVYSTRSPLYLPEWSGNDCSCVSNAEGAG